MASSTRQAPPAKVDVLVVGAGFAGLAMLHRLRGEGFHTHVVEAGSGIGGTWFWNRYPGARCDVDSTDYSYSFSDELQKEWRWSERYATQPEILRYIEHVADRFELRPDITLDTRVSEAHWDEAGSRWEVRTEPGDRISARYLIMATGCLSTTKQPDIDGIEDFAGQVVHTADWPAEGVDLAGKRVGIVGTGSSGIQVIPEIAAEVGRLHVFQRTPNFSVPARHRPLTDAERAAIIAEYPQRRERARLSPTGLAAVTPNPQSALDVDEAERQAHYEKWWDSAGFGFLLCYADLLTNQEANDTAAEFIRAKIGEQVDDPVLAEKLMPHGYPYGAKRPCVDNGYYQTFNRPNVELIDLLSTPLVKTTRNGLCTTEAEYSLDVLIFATGFDAMTGSLLKPVIRGHDGVTLREHWRAGPLTYLGVTTSGFPNLFIVAGPGSPSLLGNVLVSIEQHVDWISDLLTRSRSEGKPTIDTAPGAEQDWVRHVNDTAAHMLYTAANSYYLGAEVPGKPRVFMPYAGGLRRYRRECDKVARDGYPGLIRN
ncbi:NAD(P)/FAD-dependent oxidoreductase [Amycolatopsis ultiminotia]|uniref:NAD(P)/FAD-dependent oxidoreductase n=2 Tax=Amycolatopsis ultiminotia TaxID=543629 RepID=A0ABP6UUM5_9PSEU